MDSKIQKELFQIEHDLIELSKKADELRKFIEVDASEKPTMRNLYCSSLEQSSHVLELVSLKFHIIAL